MEKDLNKRKNDLLRSMMKNPKLSKTLKDAFNAPIGSTKRKHAKSIFSIMNKVNNPQEMVLMDGKGGPYASPAQEAQQYSSFQDNSMMIFPNAPKFKSSQDLSDISISSLDFGKTKEDTGLTGYNSQDSKIQDNLYATDQLSENIRDLTESPGISGGWKKQDETDLSDEVKLSELKGPMIKEKISGLTGSGAYREVPDPDFKIDTPESVSGVAKSVQDSVKGVTGEGRIPTGKLNLSYQGYEKPTEGETYGPTKPITGGTSGTGTGDSKLDSIAAQARRAVSEGTGPGFFAQSIVDEKYGGNLLSYVNDWGEKLKESFGLDKLEIELSNLKAHKENLIPKVKEYYSTRDKYLKYINQMIDRTEASLADKDLSFPSTAKSYQKYLTYLYGLKGRQNQRYGNYLDSAIADYNAEVTRQQTHYNSVYDMYKNQMNRVEDLSEFDYKNTYNSMVDFYNTLDGAEEKQLNLEMLRQQKYLNNVKIAEALLDQNEESTYSMENVQKYRERFEDNKENQSMKDVLGSEGLAGYFAEAMEGEDGGLPTEVAKAIRLTMTNELATSGGSIEKIQEHRGLLDDLKSVEGGSTLANMIEPSWKQKLEDDGLVSDYILYNIKDVKHAIKDLPEGRNLKNKQEWKQDYSSLDSNVLDDIYKFVDSTVSSGNQNPKMWVSGWLTGSDEVAADRISNDLIFSW